MKKRFMAWLLTLAMLLTVFSPLSAMADDFDPECQYPEDMPSTDDVVFSDPDDDPGAPCVVSAQDGTLSIAQIREKFPDGKYWNHAGNPGASNSVNNQDGWTNTPCPRHKTVGTSAQTCNGFAPSGTQLSWQCMGYAEKIGYDITGYNPRNNAHGWSTSKNVSALDSLKPGDIVRYKNDGHSIYVLGVDGDTVTYTDCNSDGHCKIRWDVTISKSTLASSFTYVRSAPFAISGGTNNLPVLCVDVLQGWQNHIYVKGWAFDPDNTSAKLAVHVYINGEGHEIIANKYHDQGLDDTFHCGTDHGFDQDILTEETGEVTVTIYAIDSQDVNQHSEPFDNSTYKNPTKVTVTSDKTGPTITNAKVTNVDSTGYTVTCTVTDASGVNRVQFPTWTEKNGQDDLLSNWEVNPKASGTRNGNTFTFRVKTSDHNNESGVYNTHIYAYDNSYRGNCAGAVTLTATVPVPTVAVSGVRLNKTSLSFTGTGSSQTLTATVSPSNATNKTLTWSSSNTSVATVSNGVVKAVGFGTATITAKSNNGKTASCSVTVNPIQPTGIKATPETSTLYGLNGTVKLSANVMPSNATNKTVTWSSRNTSVATVSSDGTVKAVGYGTTVITAKTVNGLTSNCTVTVNPIAVTGVSLNKTSLSFTGTGSSQTLTATVSPSNATNKTLTWSSSNTSVATVSNGVVKAVGFGTATITAKSNNGKTASCSVTVNPIQPTGIKATPETSTLYGLNGTVKLSANVMPSNATNKAVTWSSRNTSVATVSSDGTVKAVGYGTTVITATTVNGLTSNCTINVKKEEVTSLTIATKPTKTNYYVGDTLNTAGLTLKAAYNNGTTQTITGGFTCTPTALSTAGAQTVTVNYGGKTATFTVSVELPVLPFVTLTFDPTDGVLDLADTPEKTVYPGEAYGRLPEPTADGMVFLGWYTESGKRITSLTTCDLTGDATVSARWALASAEGWSFDEATGTLTLDGSGAMKEYTSAAEAPWYSYRDSIEHLVVKSGVTSLSSYAFVGCQNLADITLPDTLQTIGTMTFYGCDSLNNVTIPASVRTIGSYAFADALSLSRITFAGDAPEFGTGVFTFRKLTAYYPVYASGWETVVDGRYDFGGSITWVRSSESLTAEESVLLSAAEPDDVLALDWTL